MSNLLLQMGFMVQVRPVDIDRITSIDMTIKNTLKSMLDNDRQALAFIKRGYDAISTGKVEEKKKQLAKVASIVNAHAIGMTDSKTPEKLLNAAMGVLMAPNDWEEGDYLDVIPCKIVADQTGTQMIEFPIKMFIPLPLYKGYHFVCIHRNQYLLKGDELHVTCEVEAEPIIEPITTTSAAND